MTLTPYQKIMRIFDRLNRDSFPGTNYLYVYRDNDGVEKYEIRRWHQRPTYNVGGKLFNPNGERLGIAFNN